MGIKRIAQKDNQQVMKENGLRNIPADDIADGLLNELVPNKRRIKDRVDKTIDGLLEGKSITRSAIEAGYGKEYARSGQKHIRKTISRRLEQYSSDGLPMDAYFDTGRLLMEYKKITEQDKDMATKLKAISPILQKHNIIPRETDDRPQPILNITLMNTEANTKKEIKQADIMEIENDPINP